MPFFSISGSDFVEMFVGVGASRVRDLFEQGKKNAPCIIFIDEIDAVGRHRGAGLGGGHDEREQTLNQLLVEMDGFESNEGVILIAATNRPDVLDPALLRPGRFDRRIVVNPPDVKGREGILEVHTTEIPLASDVDLAGHRPIDARVLRRRSGQPRQRGRPAGRPFNKMKVDMVDFEFAKDKVMMGSERRSLVMSEEEKRNTAYHEAGHALVAVMVPEADPLHKVTIIPRGMALGLTMQLPEGDRYTSTRAYLEGQLRVLMGGRLAEELVFGSESMTTGAGNDLERATELARKMVCEWGMSSKMGPLTFGKQEQNIFLGKEFARHQDYSESTAVEIDQEIRRIITEAYDEARTILDEHRPALEAIAAGLLEDEVLDGEEIYGLIATRLRCRCRRHQATQDEEPARRSQRRRDDDQTTPNPTATAARLDELWTLRGPVVMGIVNCTPDSFSDGGRFLDCGPAIREAERQIDEGAHIIDIGGHQTRLCTAFCRSSY